MVNKDVYYDDALYNFNFTYLLTYFYLLNYINGEIILSSPRQLQESQKTVILLN